jgi:hypothetical protein
MTDRILHAALEPRAIDDELVRDVATSADAQAEVVALIAVFAALPGPGAVAAIARLDHLLDAATALAAAELVAVAQLEMSSRT